MGSTTFSNYYLALINHRFLGHFGAIDHESSFPGRQCGAGAGIGRRYRRPSLSP